VGEELQGGKELGLGENHFNEKKRGVMEKLHFRKGRVFTRGKCPALKGGY